MSSMSPAHPASPVSSGRRLRRRPTALLVAVLLSCMAAALPVAASSAPASAAQASAPGKAMWVWTQPAAKTLVTFARNRGVTDLYLAVPLDLPRSPALSWVRSVHKAARGTGIQLHALGGDPGWIDEPGVGAAWARAAVSTGLFAGVEIDVEPWLNPAWDTDRAGVVDRYLATLDEVVAASSVPVGADIAFWLHTVTTRDGARLDTAVLSRVARVTIMAYRDTVTGADSITDISATTLSAGEAMGVPVRLGVETRYLGEGAVAAKQTFHGQPVGDLTRALAEVDALLAGSPAYAGTAVHDYEGWSALR